MRPYFIRDVKIDPPLTLAPMEGVTDLTFRRLIRQIGGCGLTVTEFIPASQLQMNVAQARRLAAFDGDERPISIQVYGRDPYTLGEAARIVQDLGADIVDVNMGCPSKKVCAHSGGSALMREPELAKAIVASMRAAVTIPLTVKMRAGWDASYKNAPELARICEGEGAEAIAVHWRTRADLYGGERDLSTIASVKQAVSVPVIANGDIVDAISAVDTLQETGADGLMIGRGAVRNPWVFLEIVAALTGGAAPVVDDLERERVLMGYFHTIRDVFVSDKAGLGRFKKIARYFTEGIDDGDALRTMIFRSQTPDEASAKVRAFFAARRGRDQTSAHALTMAASAMATPAATGR